MSLLSNIAHYQQLLAQRSAPDGLDLGDSLALEGLKALLGYEHHRPAGLRSLVTVGGSEIVCRDIHLHREGAVVRGLPQLSRDGIWVKLRFDDEDGKSYLFTGRVAWTQLADGQRSAGIRFCGAPVVLSWSKGRRVPQAVTMLESKMQAA